MRIFLLIIITSLFLVSCGTKRQYFVPENIQGSINFDGDLPSFIEEVNIAGATLNNRQVISLQGLEKDKILNKHELFFGKYGDKFITSNQNGTINIKNNNGDIYFSKDITSMIASASLEDESLAIVTADNTLYLIDINFDKVLFLQKMDDISAVDSRIAVPYFLGSLVVFPTLDGKLTIIDRYNGDLVRNVVISAEGHFNNVIFLDVTADRMVASTAKRIISINPAGVSYIDEDVKDALLLSDRIFIFTKDGRAILTDLDLKIIKEKKFPFAIFSGVLASDSLYIIEKKGHLIKTNLNLEDIEIFKFPTEINKQLFIGNSKAYYNNKYIDFNFNRP